MCGGFLFSGRRDFCRKKHFFTRTKGTHRTFFSADTGGIPLLSGGDELKKIHMAICEKDTEYMQKLGNYIKKQEKEMFEIQFFSEQAYLKEELEKRTFDILVVGEEFLRIGEQSKKQTMCIYLTEGNATEEYSSCPILFKYQAADSILRGIQYYWQDFSGVQTEQIFYGKKEIISVFSPAGSAYQTPVALGLAEVLSQREKVLYINFKVCSGFCELSGLDSGMDLGDLFYLVKEDENRFLAKLKSSVNAYGSFHVILPIRNPEVLSEIGKEEIRSFLKCLAERTEYEVILLDIAMMAGWFELLSASDKILIPRTKEHFEKAAINEMETLLEKKQGGLQKKLRTVQLAQRYEGNDTYQIEEIMMNEIGQAIRALSEEEEFFGEGKDFGADHRGSESKAGDDGFGVEGMY